MESQWLLCVLLLVAWYLSASNLRRVTRRFGNRRSLSPVRIRYVEYMGRLMLAILFVVLILLVLGLGYGEVSFFVSSVFAVIGIALFAQWSMLSNITASFIIFFAFPYRVGNRIKVVDKDDDISGVIEEIGVFHVLIRRDCGDIVTYPNNLILQKPVIRLDGPGIKAPLKSSGERSKAAAVGAVETPGGEADV